MSLCPQCIESGERRCPVGEVWEKYKREAKKQSHILWKQLRDKDATLPDGRPIINSMQSALTQEIEGERARLLAMALYNGCQIELKES